EDRVDPGRGFGTHPHDNMEILSYVIDGTIEHKDSMGNGSTITAGELQRMTAGSGVTHSEFNHSPSNPLHFLQIWIHPDERDLQPGYEQREFPFDERMGELLLIASKDGRDDSITVHQDISLFAGRFEMGQSVERELSSDRHGWLQIVRGEIQANEETLRAGDGAAITGPADLRLTASSDAELLLFDLN
ncbi:MAG: pirin family protein, partial [Planctomycetota bacterium]